MCATKLQSWRDGGCLAIALFAALGTSGCDWVNREPFPVIRTEINVGYGTMDYDFQSFGWIDDQRLVVLVGERKDTTPRQSGREIQSLQVWDAPSKTLTPLVSADVETLCVAGNFVRYNTRKTNADGSVTRAYFAGAINDIRSSEAGHINRMDCRLLKDQPLPKWAQALPVANVRRLRAEHGFIVIDRKGSDWPRTVRWYRQTAPDAESYVQELIGLFSPSNLHLGFGLTPRYFDFTNAYLLGYHHDDGYLKWLRLNNDKAPPNEPHRDVVVVPPSMHSSLLSPTSAGAVIGMRDMDVRSIRQGGLYISQGNKSLARAVRGRIGKEIRVSPNGCLVAYGNDDRASIDVTQPGAGALHYKLQVINLCEENPK